MRTCPPIDREFEDGKFSVHTTVSTGLHSQTVFSNEVILTNYSFHFSERQFRMSLFSLATLLYSSEFHR